MKIALLAVLVVGVVVAAASGQAPIADERAAGAHKQVDGFTVRPGFRVNIAVGQVPGARFLETDGKGTLFISRMRFGDILACRDEDGDGVYEKQTTFLSEKPKVHGMCFQAPAGNEAGWLWFATDGAIYKARDTNGDGAADQTIEVIAPGKIPSGGQHNWRSLLVTRDSIFTSIGDSGNISDQTKTDRQKIWRFDLEGGNKRLFASGLRNTEKLRLRPGTEEIWGFDHGSDNFGVPVGDVPPSNQPVTDLNPPEELNRYVQDGFYGHPFVVGDRLPRYEYREREDIHDLAARTIPPEFKLGAHWACNGWCFIDPAVNAAGKPGVTLPRELSGDILVAAHGSWNSSTPVGYCVARVLFDDGRPYGLLKIVDTLDHETRKVLARPVDCLQMPDGSVMFSSDQPGRVYRITGDGTPSK